MKDRTDEAPDPSGRSARSSLSLGAAALLLIVALGAWLSTRGELSAGATSSGPSVHRSPAGDGSFTPVVSPTRTPASLGPSTLLRAGRHSLSVGRVPFSFSILTAGWRMVGNLYISKSTVGPQGAEAIIYWTTIGGGAYADPCGQWWGAPDGSMADFAASASRARGTELVTEPSNIIVGGQAATKVVFRVRRDVGCDPGFFYTWRDSNDGAFWTGTEVGDAVRVRLVKVGGKLLFIEGDTHRYAGTQLGREIQQIVGSMRFD
jgi:hypothetical protein